MGAGSITFNVAANQAQKVQAYQQSVDQAKALGLPTPTPAVPGIPCSISTGAGNTAYSSGSVIIGTVVNGKDTTMQCGNNGQWTTCNGCLLTTIPVYLQDIKAYEAKYLQPGESTAFEQSYMRATNPPTTLQPANNKPFRRYPMVGNRMC